MTWTYFVFVTSALLLTPGPTNTLLVLCSASKGIRGSLILIPAEVLGYLTTVVPLGWFAESLLHSQPKLSMVIRGLAVSWVLYMTARLKTHMSNTARTVGPLEVFVTTLLNPKALVFGLLLFPSLRQAGLTVTTCIFSILVITASCIWITIGDQIVRRAKLSIPFVQNFTRGVLYLFAVVMATSLILDLNKATG
ncbi:LysE family transporter [Rhizobium laguerreae]|nr:LysE family transporter [Rhizobium laguerreae]